MTREQSTCRSFIFGLILALFVATGCGVGEESGSDRQPAMDAESSKDSILAVLNTQVEAWNQGNIRAFMDGYAETDSLRFASGGNVWYGWDRTLQRYQETYIDEEMMGSLSFDSLDVRVLSFDHAMVFGRWELARSETYSNVGGLFTLLFEKRPQGWRIVHDHTSARTPVASDSLTTD